MTTRKLRTALLAGFGLWMLACAAQAYAQQPEPVFTANMPVSESNALSEMSSSGPFPTAPDSINSSHNMAKMPQVPLNPAAVKFVQQYIQKNNEDLQKVAIRSTPVFKIIEPVLAKYDLPVELKYLAVVESDLKGAAVSRVGAAGLWQLMPGTARELGLHVSRKRDERKQSYKSTVAAAKYLRDLYRYYDDWLLVLAAYNAGPLVVDRAIHRAGSHNFWKLQRFLPAETRGHVKRFIGTHYFFEDGGSETTLTKAETLAYAKTMAQFYSAQQSDVKLKPVVSFASQVHASTTDSLQVNKIEAIAVRNEK